MARRKEETPYNSPLAMRRWRTQAHEKNLPRVFSFAAVGIGIGIAFGIEIAIDRHFDIDADSNPDSDAGVSRYQLYFGNRYC